MQFVDETHLRRIIDKIVSQVGRRVDEANPMVDARLPDGSRVNVIVHPLAIGGPFMTIRKFSEGPVHGRRPDQLRVVHAAGRALHQRSACAAASTSWSAAVPVPGRRRCSTCSRSFIPSDERIVTVEDAKELQLHQEHVLPLRSAPAEHRGQGRGQDPRPRAQLAAYAARPHRRR